MKRFLFLFLVLSMLIGLGSATAQGTKADKAGKPAAFAGKIMDKLDLSETEVEKMAAVVEQHAQSLRLAEADLDIFKAQIQKELLLDKPSMEVLKDLVHKSMVVEESIRMSQIERHLALRAILGQERWADLSRWIRTNREMIRDGSAKLKELDPRILGLLRILAAQ